MAKYKDPKDRPPPTPKKPQPWDVQPAPPQGDAENDVFWAVGKALTQWERFEYHVAVVFSQLVGSRGSADGAVRAFGAVTSFSGRMDMLKAAAEPYFAQFPSDYLESHLKNLINAAIEWSNRRNEIAHGVVQYYSVVSAKPSLTGYVLAPAMQVTGKRKYLREHVKQPWRTLSPKYIYGASQIDYYAAHFAHQISPWSFASSDMLRARVTKKPEP